MQRAFVSFSTDARVFPVVKDKQFVGVFLEIPFENSGTTPTKFLKQTIKRSEVGQAVPEDFFRGDYWKDDKAAVLGPKDKLYGGHIYVPAGEMDALKHRTESTEHVYIFGRATYYDVFDHTARHVTKFCYELTGFADNPVTSSPAEAIFTLCESQRYNCADSECQE